MAKPLESKPERDFNAFLDEQKIPYIKCKKKGWPDKQIFLGKGYSFFIEFKRTINDEPEPYQKHIHSILRKRGYHVYVVHTYAQAIAIYKKEKTLRTRKAP